MALNLAHPSRGSPFTEGALAGTEFRRDLGAGSDVTEKPMRDDTTATLIEDYRTEMMEPSCHPGAGRFGLRVVLPVDISAVLPYLNGVWENASFDPENHILIWGDTQQKYALRPQEIVIGRVLDPEDGCRAAADIVEKVNAVWREREALTPSYAQKRLPTAIAVFGLLPKTNCGECGFPTCLAFAAELRQGSVSVDSCPPLRARDAADTRQQILDLFSGS